MNAPRLMDRRERTDELSQHLAQACFIEDRAADRHLTGIDRRIVGAQRIAEPYRAGAPRRPRVGTVRTLRVGPARRANVLDEVLPADQLHREEPLALLVGELPEAHEVL